MTAEMRGGSITLGDRLGFIKEIREDIAGGPHFFLHFGRAVVRIILNVIGVNPCHPHVAGQVIPRELRHCSANVNDVRTMVAHENHQQRSLALEAGERHEFSIRVW